MRRIHFVRQSGKSIGTIPLTVPSARGTNTLRKKRSGGHQKEQKESTKRGFKIHGVPTGMLFKPFRCTQNSVHGRYPELGIGKSELSLFLKGIPYKRHCLLLEPIGPNEHQNNLVSLSKQNFSEQKFSKLDWTNHFPAGRKRTQLRSNKSIRRNYKLLESRKPAL